MPQTLLATVAQVGSILGVSSTAGAMLFGRTLPWLRTRLDSRKLYKQPGNVLEKPEIEQAIRYYVQPRCQSLDPADADDPALIVAGKEKLFGLLDEVLGRTTQHRCIFILADSGMGKTCALVNYQARHLRSHRSFKIALVPLGTRDADARIHAIDDKRNTVLFLDAFDEDTQAIVDHVERIRILLRDTEDFRRVVITCRTQFFSKDEEIPQRTGIIRLGPRSAGEPSEYLFHKIYLSPFSDTEVGRYLRRRYPFWRMKERRRSLQIVAKMPKLRFRPMLLAHVGDIIHSRRQINYSFQIYEEMVKAWLVREERIVVAEKESLRRFSELLAVDLFVNREKRGSERISRLEIEGLAKEWNIPIDTWLLTGRSLLNRDADGNFKFAHRSIMEYLCVMSVARGETRCLLVDWTDQMKSFLGDILLARKKEEPLDFFDALVVSLASSGAFGAAVIAETLPFVRGAYALSIFGLLASTIMKQSTIVDIDIIATKLFTLRNSRRRVGDFVETLSDPQIYKVDNEKFAEFFRIITPNVDEVLYNAPLTPA